MADKAFTLWLEFEHTTPTDGDDLEDDMFNMQINVATGNKYALNVWTYEFLRHAVAQCKRDGENLNEKYLEPPDLFVERLDRKLLEEIVADLIKRDALLEAWRVSPEDVS